MAWREITEDDLLHRLSGDELSALRTAGLGDSQDDPVSEHISQITETARGYIAAHAENELGPAGTLPERLIRAACDMLVIDASSRLGGLLIDLNETRVEANKAAIRLMERVAEGKFEIEAPDTAGDDSPTPPSPSMYDKTSNWTRAKQEGI